MIGPWDAFDVVVLILIILIIVIKLVYKNQIPNIKDVRIKYFEFDF